jgi:hypothetical protein
LTFSVQHTKTQHVTKTRGRHCGDIDLETCLANVVGPVSLELDLRIDHDRFGSRSDLNINGHLHYTNDMHNSLNEVAADKNGNIALTVITILLVQSPL